MSNILKANNMKFLTTYLQPGEEIKYRAKIHIFTRWRN